MANYYLTGKIKISFWLFIISLFSLEADAQYPSQKPVSARIDYAIGGYYEWLPPDYNSQPQKKYPLLIFLHGIGEIGNGSREQLSRVLRNGPPKLINEKKFPVSFTVDSQQFSFIVLSPQLNSNARNYTAIDSLIQFALQKYRVDEERIYLTGLSMGGGIAWIYAGAKKRFADRLAALLIVSGNTRPYPGNVRILVSSNLPIKVMHNSGDPTVPSFYSVNWVNELNKAIPPIHPRAAITVFDSNAHNAWTKAYDPEYKENNKNVYEWMLSYRRTKDSLH